MSEEIDLNGVAPKKPDVDHIETHYGKVDINPNASAYDLINSYLNTPEDKLIPWEECHLPSRGAYYG